MEKLLLIGIDTRSMLNSALKLDYELYSASYFSTSDTPTIKNQKIILKESDGESCGNFEEEFNNHTLLELSKDYIDEVNYIIPISGVSPGDFTKKDQRKILGNVNVRDVEDKFRFHKKIKDEFQTPMTFHISDMDEAIEINENYQDTKFILKPLQGSGGYDVNLLNNDKTIELNDNEFIMQEYIDGITLSSSVLSSENQAKTIANTRLLTQKDYGIKNSFRYIGNILPLTGESIMANVSDIGDVLDEMTNTSEELIEKFKLVGSNGVDYILSKKGLYVIEINPRIQGTFECVEKTFNINMLEAHIKACQGKLIDMPQPKCYTYKKIVYSPVRMKYAPIDLNNIYDLPHAGSITERDEPLLTIIDEDDDFEKLCRKVESASKIVDEASKTNRQDA